MTATAKQLETIDGLVTELGLEGTVKDGVYEIARRRDARPAHEVRDLISGMITQAQARRRARADEIRAARPAAEPVPAGRGLWEGVPDGRYAIPADVLARHTAAPVAGGNDLVFVRVSTWTPPGKGPVTFLRQLHGAPGAFTKTKLERPVERAVREALRDLTPVEAGLLFSKHYTVCARCASELTDMRSRETGYGPDCREAMGLAR